MRRTLIEGLLNGPLTEAAPGADDPELAALAARGRARRRREPRPQPVDPSRRRRLV